MTRRRSRRSGIAVGLAALVALTSLRGEGRADLASDAYQDAKAVIEELLTAEITRSLVPQIVCRAGRQEAVFSDPDCAADGGGAESLGADPTSPVVCLRRADADRPHELRRQRVTLKLLEYFPATLQAVYSRRFAALRSTVGSEVIDVASETFYDSLRGDLRAIERQATRDASVRTALDYANEIAPAAATVFSRLPAEAFHDCLEQVTAKLSAGLTGSVSRLDRECTPSSDDNALECELATSLRLALRGQPKEAEARLLRSVALILAHCLLGQPLLAEWPPGDGPARLKRTADEILGLLAAWRGGGAAGGAAAADAAFETFAARLAAVLGAPRDKLLPLLGAKRGAFEQVAARLRGVSDGGAVPLTLTTLIADLGDVLRGKGALCDGVTSPACNLLDEIPVRIGVRSVVWSAVTAASSGDLRGVAHLVLNALFPRATGGTRCDQQSQSEGCRADAYRRFADSLVLYVLDATDGDASASVRAVFRQSAAEVVRFLSPFGGLDRGEPVLWYVPELLMRASWSSGFLDAGDLGQEHLRYSVGLNFVRFRKTLLYTDRSYASLQLSLVDPIAPLAELVLRAERDPVTRGAIHYERSVLVLWNAIAPRLELTLALPWFSKHLAVSAGAGLRLVAPTEGQLDASGERTQTYRSFLHDEDDWYDFLEASLSLKYLL